MAATSLYAGLLGLWLVVLSARVIAVRRSDRVSLGVGDSTALERRVRAQANFAEYAPMGLLLLALLEASAGSAWWLHAIGVMLVAGRLLHGWALSFTDGNVPGRIGGMVLTFAAVALAGAGNLVVALSP